jgi:ABC-type uncharacterized transport system YnjBCD substrate-binding protein
VAVSSPRASARALAARGARRAATAARARGADGRRGRPQANTNFVAIPKNAPSKAAALMTANVIASGQAMLTRSRPHV